MNFLFHNDLIFNYYFVFSYERGPTACKGANAPGKALKRG